MGNQEITGKAFEYACIKSLYEFLSSKCKVNLESSLSLQNAQKSYCQLSNEEQQKYIVAARKGIEIIVPLEPNLLYSDKQDALVLSIQSDKQGQKGDVRDVLCLRDEKGWSIGLSCKHNHEAVKHSRLSRTIDFGYEWMGHPVSGQYKNTIKPIFDELDFLKSNKLKWSEIKEKDLRFYLPLLKAFKAELEYLYSCFNEDIPINLLHYLLGRHDFYKVIAHSADSTTEVKPFNIYNTLGQAVKDKKPQYKLHQLKMPDQILSIELKKNSLTTLLIYCNNGWTLSLRIHNASESVESSLKFDIQLIGVPSNLGSRRESW